MRQVVVFAGSSVLVLAACAACGLATPAVAEPRPGGVGLGALAPLVPAPLDDDAAAATAIREYYTKYEYRIPMRDGAHLFTSVYAPKDRSRKYAILLSRTPYSVAPYGVDVYPGAGDARVLQRIAPSRALLRDGFVFVHQDVRGRMMSEGTFVDVRPHATNAGGVDESTDAYDTIDWLVRNVPNNNGRVGVWGISYPGFYAAQSAVGAHPALKAVSPQAPVTEWFVGDDFHHNGALFLADAFDFYSNFGKPRPEPTKKASWSFDHDAADVYDFFLRLGPLSNADGRMKDIAFWHDLTSHGTRDAFWKARDPRPFYRGATPAVMTVGGWFDAEDLFGALATYHAFESQGPKSENVLVMGPWKHGGWARTDGASLGDVTFGAKTSRFYQEQIERPFFRRHLLGEAGPAAAEAWVFETGRNEWHAFPAWPPKGTVPVTLSFHAGGVLSSAKVREAGADAYVSDPSKPVPYRGDLSTRIDNEYMTGDQRFASRRPDVLVYRTGELEGDVTVVGPIRAHLFVSTTGTDADFVVKVIDVYPEDLPDSPAGGVKMGGYQQLVRAEVMRGKFRASFETPTPFRPGEVTSVSFTLPDVCHTFRTGHRIMVQVQSSWFPLVDRNPQTFVDIYRASAKDFQVATHQVHRRPEQSSGVDLTVLAGAQLINGL